MFAYDGANVAGEYDAAGNASVLYAQGLGIDEPLAMSKAGTTSYYDADGLGSVTSLTDSAGSAVAAYTRDAFGKALTTADTVGNRYRYTGREWDEDTNLYYYRARYYDDVTGRFLSEDPLGFEGSGVNLYGYAHGNPVRFVDPFGTCIIELYVVRTGEHSDGVFYHSFLILYDNSGTRKGNPAREFRGGPGPGTPPLVDSGFAPFVGGGTAPSQDQPGDALYAKVLLNNDCPCNEYDGKLQDLIAGINNAKIPYGPFTNSNSVTYSAIDALGLQQPQIPIDVRKFLFGWGKKLP